MAITAMMIEGPLAGQYVAVQSNCLDINVPELIKFGSTIEDLEFGFKIKRAVYRNTGHQVEPGIYAFEWRDDG